MEKNVEITEMQETIPLIPTLSEKKEERKLKHVCKAYDDSKNDQLNSQRIHRLRPKLSKSLKLNLKYKWLFCTGCSQKSSSWYNKKEPKFTFLIPSERSS